MVARTMKTSSNRTQKHRKLSAEEEIDYAATSDAMVQGEDEDEDEGLAVDDDDSDDNIGADDGHTDDSERLEGRGENYLNHGESGDSDDDDESVEIAENENDDDDDDDQIGEDEEPRRPLIDNNIFIPGDEPCTFDLRNLLGVSAHPIDSASLYVPAKISKNLASADSTTPTTIDRSYFVNEEYLLKKAIAGCSQIVSALWQLPVERTNAGPMVQLPTFDDSKIPRALVCAMLRCSPSYCLAASHLLYRATCVLKAATCPKSRNEMGKVCQDKGHWSEQGKEVCQSV
jgi:hypothetical protein